MNSVEPPSAGIRHKKTFQEPESGNRTKLGSEKGRDGNDS